VQLQCATIWTNQVVDNCNTEVDDAKSVVTDTTTFSKAETICNLKALKEKNQLKLIDKLFVPEQLDF
jgi:hypothetical protein